MRFSPYDTVAVIKGEIIPNTDIQICEKTFQGFLCNSFSRHSYSYQKNTETIDIYKTIYLARIPNAGKNIKKVYAKKKDLTLHSARIILIEKIM